MAKWPIYVCLYSQQIQHTAPTNHWRIGGLPQPLELGNQWGRLAIGWDRQNCFSEVLASRQIVFHYCQFFYIRILKKVQLSLEKTRYRLHSSCCSADLYLQGHQGQWFLFYVKGRMRFPISDLYQPWPYLLPFLKYGHFTVEKRLFLLPVFCLNFENVPLTLGRWNFMCLGLRHRVDYLYKRFYQTLTANHNTSVTDDGWRTTDRRQRCQRRRTA